MLWIFCALIYYCLFMPNPSGAGLLDLDQIAETMNLTDKYINIIVATGHTQKDKYL